MDSFTIIGKDLLLCVSNLPPQYAGGFLLGGNSQTIIALERKPSQKHIDNHYDLLGWTWIDNEIIESINHL